MKQDAFLDVIRLLCEDEAPRVWSLIVTIFGDLAQGDGDSLSGPVLGAILSPVGVRPEAMRVALHRLRNEGWIETSKRGREAFHSLSAMGLRQSSLASGKIYGAAPCAQPKWHLLCCPPVLATEEHTRAKSMSADGYVTVAAGVYLANGSAAVVAKDAFCISGEMSAVPEWLGHTLAPQVLRGAFEDLSNLLAQVQRACEEPMSPLQIATLRALIVHRWRKLVLRLPNVPDLLFGTDFEGTICRQHVLTVLESLPRPALSTLRSGAL